MNMIFNVFVRYFVLKVLLFLSILFHDLSYCKNTESTKTYLLSIE